MICVKEILDEQPQVTVEAPKKKVVFKNVTMKDYENCTDSLERYECFKVMFMEINDKIVVSLCKKLNNVQATQFKTLNMYIKNAIDTAPASTYKQI